jgi:hypothetical protein
MCAVCWGAQPYRGMGGCEPPECVLLLHCMFGQRRACVAGCVLHS